MGTVRAELHPFGQSWIIPGSWHIIPCVACEKNGLLRAGKTPWCWEHPHPLSAHPSVPRPGCRVGAGEQSWGAGNPKSRSVELWMEPEWLGLRGLRTGRGVHIPSFRGHPEACPEFLACPRGEILFPLHQPPGKAGSREYSARSLSNSTEHSSQTGKIPALWWDPAKPEGNSPSVPRLCCPWDGIPRFHPKVSSQGFIKNISLESCS